MSPGSRAAVVIGGAAGIGRQTVGRFVSAGDRVFAVDEDLEALAGLTAKYGEQVTGLNIEVTDRSGLVVAARLVAETVAAETPAGGVDVLVCAAGIERYGTVVDTPASTYDEVMAVNVAGVFFACQSFIPLIRPGGSVVVIASAQADGPPKNMAAYSMGKGALLSLVRAMAVDHAPDGVRVNAVCPGSDDGRRLGLAEFGDKVARSASSESLGRMTTADEVAEAIYHLVDPSAKFVTGMDLRVDGRSLVQSASFLPEGK